MSNPTTYWDYIQVEALLALQGGLERDDAKITNDEVMFITVHQIDELWMKLLVRELVAARDLFVRVPVPEQSLAAAVRGVDRMTTLLRMIAEHFALMETLTTRAYLAFRDKLNPASGFQSAQLREIEILSWMLEDDRIPHGQEKSYLQMLLYADGTPPPPYPRVPRPFEHPPTPPPPAPSRPSPTPLPPPILFSETFGG